MEEESELKNANQSKDVSLVFIWSGSGSQRPKQSAESIKTIELKYFSRAPKTSAPKIPT